MICNIEKEEQTVNYLDKVNEAYEVSIWYEKINNDIEKTTNKAMKE